MSSSLRLISSLFALTLMTTLVACGEKTSPPAANTTAPKTEEPMAKTTEKTPETPAKEETTAPVKEETTAPVKEETKTPKTKKSASIKNLEDTLLKTLGEQLPGTELTSMSCPADVKMKAAETFDCEVIVPDGKFSIGVTMQDDKGNLVFKSKGIVSLVKLEKTLQQSILEQTKVETITDCGSSKNTLYFFKKIGETFECKVTNKATGKAQQAEITINTDGGDVSFKM